MSSRRQHTISQYYLRRFLSPGFVYRLGALHPRATKNPSDVAVHKDYYSRNISSDVTLDRINSFIERDGAPVFMKIIDKPSNITEGDLRILSYLLANMYVRTPAIIEEIRASSLEMMSQANTMAAKMLEKIQETKLTAKEASEFLSPEPSDDSTTMTLQQLNEYFNRLRKRGGHRVAAEGTFYALKDTAESIQQMSMWLVESPRNRFFITSDKPLTLRSRLTGSRVGAGWKNSDAMGLIALSPRYFLILCYQKPHGIRITSATPEQVEGLNLETMLFASEEVYSPRKYQEAYEWMRQQKRWRR